MKKYSLLFLFVSCLFACSDTEKNMPRLELETILLNGGEKDYSQNLNDILPLSQGDYINVSFLLDGNGTDLKTFVVKNDNENIESVIMPAFPSDEIADEFTDKGVLGYKDGIQHSSIAVKLTVRTARTERLRVGFYLNSKAPNSKGAIYYLDLETTIQPREVEEEE
ncbi:MAG: DUF5035 family protein [Mediterranea sp.]|jgi:hypothetical protein|nr:DUF5035 family protein [Mediterranea sp.]